jgi:hypothetical protein
LLKTFISLFIREIVKFSCDIFIWFGYQNHTGLIE